MTNVTRLLGEASEGNPGAQDALYRLIEPELRKLALHWIRRKAAKGRVRTTEVISEAYLKLLKIDSPGWQHRGHFFRFASRNILCVLIDLLRRLPPPAAEVSEESRAPGGGLTLHSLEALSAALEALERDLSPTHRQVIELRFLCECTLEEAAELLSTPDEALSRDRVFRLSTVALGYLRGKLRTSFPDLVGLPCRDQGDE